MSEVFQTKRSYNLLLHGVGIAGVITIILVMLFVRQNAHAELSQIDFAQSESLALLKKNDEIQAANHDVKQRVQLTESRVSQLKATIPTAAGEIDFLSELSELAKSTDFQIRDFRPGTAVAKGLHREMDVRFVGEGTYNAFCQFLDGLRQLPRSYRIAQLSVTAPRNSEQPFSADCQLRLLFDLNSDLISSEKL